MINLDYLNVFLFPQSETVRPFLFISFIPLMVSADASENFCLSSGELFILYSEGNCCHHLNQPGTFFQSKFLS